jgi:hypothetical protein
VALTDEAIDKIKQMIISGRVRAGEKLPKEADLAAELGLSRNSLREDTLPDRKSPGQVVIPGLAKMTMAPDFSGRPDLYNGVLTESGGGMTMTARVLTNTDELVIHVTGADPGSTQTAEINLWSGRSAVASASGGIGTLAETWVDNTEAGYSGQTFGSLAAITADGQDVTASVTSSESVQVSFKPDAAGDFSVVVAAPHWAGGNAQQTAEQLLTQDNSAAPSIGWWHRFWARSGLVEMNSTDGSAQYIAGTPAWSRSGSRLSAARTGLV